MRPKTPARPRLPPADWEVCSPSACLYPVPRQPSRALRLGHGLTGMRERAESLGVTYWVGVPPQVSISASPQQVAVGQQRNEQALDQGGLADNFRRELVTQTEEGRMRAGAGGGTGSSVESIHVPILTDPARLWFPAPGSENRTPECETGPEGPVSYPRGCRDSGI